MRILYLVKKKIFFLFFLFFFWCFLFTSRPRSGSLGVLMVEAKNIVKSVETAYTTREFNCRLEICWLLLYTPQLYRVITLFFFRKLISILISDYIFSLASPQLLQFRCISIFFPLLILHALRVISTCVHIQELQSRIKFFLYRRLIRSFARLYKRREFTLKCTNSYGRSNRKAVTVPIDKIYLKKKKKHLKKTDTKLNLQMVDFVSSVRSILTKFIKL